MILCALAVFRTKCFSLALSAVVCVVLALPAAFSVRAVGNFDNKDKERRNGAEESDVKNFGKVNDHIYRGGQPKADEYKQLAAVGIKTVIDLREDAEEFARAAADQAGMKYINLRLNAKRPPTTEESNLFLRMVNDKENWPVYVHCAGGRHRTGVLVAVYRMEMDGWNAEQAYREMKDFKFYSRFGYGEMKEFVFDYFRGMRERPVQASGGSTRARRVTEGN